ncbi:MAG: response regulator [Deltaproteobacteria bacterium]|nr:response regulator [Deltaproteobacteria bacterium]
MRVMVVDDSGTMRRLIARAFEEEGQVTGVIEAADGLEALAKIGDDPPHLILCDIKMPKLDGLKFLSSIRSRFDSSRVRVILVTAKADQRTINSAHAAGADGLIAKPFQVADLMEKVREVMGEKPSRP